MTALDDKLIPAVFALIDDLGKSVTFHVKTGVFDQTARKFTSSTTTNYSQKVTPPDKYKIHQIDGDRVRATDLVIWLAAQSLVWTPDAANQEITVTIGSRVYRVVSVEPVYSGESACIWGFQLRL